MNTTSLAYRPEHSARADTAVRLLPIPWGKPDPELATGVLHSVARTTPPISFPFNVVRNRRLRALLAREGLAR